MTFHHDYPSGRIRENPQAQYFFIQSETHCSDAWMLICDRQLSTLYLASAPLAWQEVTRPCIEWWSSSRSSENRNEARKMLWLWIFRAPTCMVNTHLKRNQRLLFRGKLAQVAMLLNLVEKGDWKPFQTRRQSHLISHLMFVHDLLFAEASSNQMRLIRYCLQSFCDNSDQKVNAAKSKFFCSKNVPRQPAL